jgi:DNA-binding protein HU-beta
MQKTGFIKEVAEAAGVTRKDAEKVVKTALKVIEDNLKKGEKVTLTGFGTFEVRNRSARTVTSIRTKNKTTIPAGKVPGFTAGSVLKAAISGKKVEKKVDTKVAVGKK